MSERTTVVLGSAERRAAKRLASRWRVTPSDRRVLMRVAGEELDEQRERERRQRMAVLEHLIQLSDGADIEGELARSVEHRESW